MFKVGDRVECTAPEDENYEIIGCLGTVLGTNSSGKWYTVEFDRPFTDGHGGSVVGKGPSDRRWDFDVDSAPSKLALVSRPEPSIKEVAESMGIKMVKEEDDLYYFNQDGTAWFKVSKGMPEQDIDARICALLLLKEIKKGEK